MKPPTSTTTASRLYGIPLHHGPVMQLLTWTVQIANPSVAALYEDALVRFDKPPASVIMHHGKSH